jgi:acyl carrier protein
MEEKVVKILADINKEILTYEGDNLFDDGILDSLQAAEVVIALEDGLGIEIDAKYVLEENFKTKEAIFALVKKVME